MTIETINDSIQPQRDILLQHPLYQKVQNIEHLHEFLESHVYAVWDFMSLLKALQSNLTCISTPWLPIGNPEIRYLINEIVLTEETDLNIEGKRQSHYEMYIDAMKDAGANTTTIEHFIAEVVSLQNIFVAIKQSHLHNNIKAFLDFTFSVIEQGKPHEIAAAFTFGRESLIPPMFTEIIKNFQNNFPNKDLSKLIYYFERHIQLDQDEHGPMALQMVEELCGDDSHNGKKLKKFLYKPLK